MTELISDHGGHESRAFVPTHRAARYAKQLTNHFGHRVDAEWHEPVGTVRFGEGGVAVLTAEEGGLRMVATAPGSEGLATVERVVGDHLLKFATQDELRVEWVRTP
ncbi:DUF2218 domain-containing protein [Actinoalloteichus spitiensis]|uniref:DUF2218 domain-containing protein n=1 Tax=Actinoalloteichus spitiensis TaxID=252394 RepID=UPI00037B2839|nr:DUF2218 domain-containing protein [Actinoalloteichus spitiensis]